MICRVYKICILILFSYSCSPENVEQRLDTRALNAQYTIHQLEARVKQLQAEEVQRQQLLSVLSDRLLKLSRGGCGGVLFEHWGRISCPSNSDLVYSGFAAGSNYAHSGGSSQTLCLPKDPIGGSRATPPYRGIVYGAEYETKFFGPLSTNEDTPCAVCISPVHTAKLMIPGRNRCYSGWNELYHGYLAANHYGYAGSAGYTCMSEHPEFVNGGLANKNGKLFYGVISTCGSLPCPPYNASVPVTCVLCAK